MCHAYQLRNNITPPEYSDQNLDYSQDDRGRDLVTEILGSPIISKSQPNLLTSKGVSNIGNVNYKDDVNEGSSPLHWKYLPKT